MSDPLSDLTQATQADSRSFGGETPQSGGPNGDVETLNSSSETRVATHMKEEAPSTHPSAVADNKMDVDTISPPPTETDAKPITTSIGRSPSVDMLQSPPATSHTQGSSSSTLTQEEIDARVEQVVEAANASPVANTTYYVINGQWWRRFNAQSSEYQPSKDDDFDISKPVGPIDNTTIVEEVVEIFPKQRPFAILKPNLELMRDFEFVPQQTWESLVNWYGLATPSLVLPRQAVETVKDADAEIGVTNVLVDLWPPVFSIYLLNLSGPSFDALKKKAEKTGPGKIVAGKGDKFQDFLLKLKGMLELPSHGSIRLWKLRQSGNSTIPATQAIDMNTFLEFDYGTTRELVDIPDQTKAILLKKYNGNMPISDAGITDVSRLIVEVMEEEGEWPSERVSKALKVNKADNLPVRVTKGNAVTTSISSVKASSANQKSTNTTASSKANVVTRSRTARRDGKPLGAVGFQNLGNTCYMNSALQCLKSVEELTRYFLDNHYKHELNPRNPLGWGGKVASAYGNMLHSAFSHSCGASFAPRDLKHIIGKCNASFAGWGQQDSQEFLTWMLDGLHEDLNRIQVKPYNPKPDSTDEMINDPAALAGLARLCWDQYKLRNDSAVVDLFAGQYKSTLVCPVCAKVSITFDPFMANLVIPLPLENMWSKAITFVPAANSVTPFTNLLTVNVEMDKYGSVRQLKEFVGSRLGVDVNKMVVSEVFRNKFYKHHEDFKSVSEVILPNDQIYIYELDTVPTNFPPPKRKKQISRSMLYTSYDDDDYEDDVDNAESQELLIPVFHRLYKDNRRIAADLFGIPFFIVLSKEEQQDYHCVLRKVIDSIQKFSTSNLYVDGFNPDNGPTLQAANGHPNVLEEEGELLNAPSIRAESDQEGPDGFVDVSMKDAASESGVEMNESDTATPDDNTDASSVSDSLYHAWDQLFTMKIYPRKGASVVPTGWNGIENNFERVSSRTVQQPGQIMPKSKKPSKVNGSRYFHSSASASEESDEDEATVDEDSNNVISGTKNDSSDASDEEDMPQQSGSNNQTVAPVATANFYSNGSGKVSTSSNTSKAVEKKPAPVIIPQTPYIRLGEGIVCDWTEDSYDAIFGGRSGDGLRGVARFDSMDEFRDDELDKKRKLRESRRRQGVHLEDCLSEFSREEVLSESDPWFCPRCKEHRRATKKIELWKVPDILVIGLKRFSSGRGSRDKIDAMVDFPITGLDMSSRIVESEGKELIYDLIACDNHFGGLGGGHYTANVRNWQDGRWYYCDDSSARQTEADSVNGSAAYVLIYRRRSAAQLGGPHYQEFFAAENTEDEEVDSPNGSSPNGDPHSSGVFSSSGSSQVMSSQPHSGDGQRGGVGGNTLSAKLPSTSVNRNVVSASSFVGQATPPPDGETDSLQLSDYASSLTKPIISSTTLFGTNPSPVASPAGGFTPLNEFGPRYDFGASNGFHQVGADLMDEGVEADDDLDEVDLITHDSPGQFNDASDDDIDPDLRNFLCNSTNIPVSVHGGRMSTSYSDDEINDGVKGVASTSHTSTPTFEPIPNAHKANVRFVQIADEFSGILASGSYALMLVLRNKQPCVLIVTDQQNKEEELENMCRSVDFELELVQGKPTLSYEMDPPTYGAHGGYEETAHPGTHLGVQGHPGKFGTLGIYVQDISSQDIFVLTTAHQFAQKDPEVDKDASEEECNASLSENTIVTQSAVLDASASTSRNDEFGVLTNVYELDAVQPVDDDHSILFDYCLIKPNLDRIGNNIVTGPEDDRKPITSVVSIHSTLDGPKGSLYTCAPSGQAVPAQYNGQFIEVHDLARFPGKTFRMPAIFVGGRDLVTEGSPGAICYSSSAFTGNRASGMVIGRAEKDGYTKGSVMHFVFPVDQIFSRIKEKFGIELKIMSKV